MTDSGEFKIFIINPGSTSTKLSYYEGYRRIVTEEVFHDSSLLLTFPDINAQLPFRLKVVENFLQENGIDLRGVDAIVGRGGGCFSVESGIYLIDSRLIEDTKNAVGGLYHASMLGVQLADALHQIYGGRMFMMDPPVVDELRDEARITGVSGIYRRSVSHALNLREAARKHAETIGRTYEACNFIICHIDGGISVVAHEKGRQVDGNDAGGGEGPFTPTRMGTMAVTDVLDHLYDKGSETIRKLCSQGGGFSSYFSTSDSDRIHRMIEEGDPKAAAVWNAMIYQIIKGIGSMAAALEGKVDGIVLTGGLLRFPEIEQRIRESCGWIAPVGSYPGEFEQEALARGALRVLEGRESAKTYSGKPVWNGFWWDKQHNE